MTIPKAVSLQSLSWDSQLPDRHQAFTFLHRDWPFFNGADWPDIDALQSWLESTDSPARGILSKSLRLIEAASASAREYETSVYVRNELHVRLRSWHDLFNVVSWRYYPHSKASINARHVRDSAATVTPNARTRVGDALTVFDENGVVVASSDSQLLSHVREFRWREVFCEQRDAWGRSAQVFVMGHALLEKLLDPFVGLTAKAVLLPVTGEFFEWGARQRFEHVDKALSEVIGAAESFRTPQWLSPLPILGVPGWYAANENPAFYDNAQYFRSGRNKRATAHGRST